MKINDGPCPQPDPAEVRRFEKKLRGEHFSAHGGMLILFGWVALVTEALTDSRLPIGARYDIGIYATYCALAYLMLYRGSLRLVRDRNFWRKSATHDLDQLHAAVMRDINEGEGWKR